MRRLSPSLAPAAITARARSTYTRAEIVVRDQGVTTFWAVYTTPEGDVADRVYCFSDALAPPRRPAGTLPS